MDIHKNARLTVHGRERIVRQGMSGQTPKAVALYQIPPTATLPRSAGFGLRAGLAGGGAPSQDSIPWVAISEPWYQRMGLCHGV
jgi:hypothetical protein